MRIYSPASLHVEKTCDAATIASHRRFTTVWPSCQSAAVSRRSKEISQPSGGQRRQKCEQKLAAMWRLVRARLWAPPLRRITSTHECYAGHARWCPAYWGCILNKQKKPF